LGLEPLDALEALEMFELLPELVVVELSEAAKA
jgi:hypothetical protein